jgi:hypothetical protein
MKAEGLRSKTGYRSRPSHFSDQPASVTPNHLARRFEVDTPTEFWVTDNTYIRTWICPRITGPRVLVSQLTAFHGTSSVKDISMHYEDVFDCNARTKLSTYP